MKYILSFIILPVLFSNCCLSKKPFSFMDSLNQLQSIELIDEFETYIPDIESIINFVDSLDNLGISHPHYYGIGIDLGLNIANNGSWDTLNNGDRVWRIKIICLNAFTINIEFEKFQLAENSNISFYSVSGSSLLGSYYSDINRTDSLFSTHLINGDTAIIELYEPLIDFGKNTFTINKIVYGFSDVISEKFLFKEARVQSDYCLVDANCEEGDEFCREKYSITRILTSSPLDQSLYTLCSGSLLNNTSLDYHPYLLTAFHCIDDGTGSLSQNEKDNANNWVIQLGYIKENCGSGSSLQTYEYYGAEFLAGWNQVKNDFVLIELLEDTK